MSRNIFDGDEILTVKQVAALLQIGEQIIYGLANQNKIPCRKVGNSWRFSKTLIHLWMIGDYDGTLVADTSLIKLISHLLDGSFTINASKQDADKEDSE
jgi:excisionase family DNA binding protein